MCGFCGVIGPARSSATADIEAMTRSLAHRGPDGSGIWKAEFRSGSADFAIALGHRRLSIIDLSERGRQPMLSADGASVISYNGEVYNFGELRAELRRLGHEFRSGTDTEVILEAYRAWGSAAFARLEGMFAFAIWDAALRRLFLVRDRLGIKPLYYRWADGTLSFGSELRALRAHSAFRARLQAGALAEYLRLGWITGEHTPYRDTFRLLPGHVLTWDAGRISVDCFWRLTDFAPRQGEPHSFEAAVDRLEEALADSVEGCLISDVPLGGFLSGGIDSSAVLALMKERARGPVRSFSIGFEQQAFDEAPFARAVARHLGTEHTELYVDRKAAVRALEELPRVYDEPLADRSSIPTLLLSQLTREHVTVALSGDGGDELFGGYDRYQKLERLLPVLRLPAPLRRPLGWMARALPGSALRNGLLRVAEAETAADLAEGFLADLDAGQAQAATGANDRHAQRFMEVFSAAPGDSAVRRAMYAEACTYMTDDVLVKVDRASMSVGLEVRVPVLERRVAELACSLPFEYLTHGGQTKAPLRALAYRRVPRSLLERPKQGFDFPIRALLGRELDAWTDEHLAPDRIAAQGLLEPAVVKGIVTAARRSGARGDARLWRLLCFQRWLAAHHPGGLDA